MTFSKKIEQENTGSNISSGDWDSWNKYIWDAFDVDSVTDAKGKEVKEADVIGCLNFIMELGNQPLADASMKSNLPVPEEGVDNSPEELERLQSYPNNYFKWVDEWDNGKMKTVRKVFWPQQPQETLVLAVDFPSIGIDYGQHPANEDATNPEVKPLRVDYNGKFKTAFERTVSNDVHWKSGKFGDKDIKYKITAACGNIEEYQNNGHDLGCLVQATCNWKLVMTRNTSDGKTYYNTKIKNPTAIQDIKTRKDVYSVSEQLEDNKCEVPFVGIFFDGSDDHYSKEQLQNIRPFWLSEAKKAIAFDRNAGTERDGTWMKGLDYADSGLAKAITKYGLDTDSSSRANTEVKSEKSNESTPVEKKPVKTASSEPEIDFDDDIPFAPLGLQYKNLHTCI